MYYRFLLNALKCCTKKKSAHENNILKDVVVSLTTTPVRIDKIWPTIHSILLQSLLPSKIYLWIPKHYKRYNNSSIKKIPEFLVNHPLIDVKFIDKDYGPATTLLPCLKMSLAPDTKIIIIDDDCVYAPNIISKLTKFSEQHQNSAITFIGSDVASGARKKYTNCLREKNVEILHGYGSYLVKPKFFSDGIFTHPEDRPELFFHDDIWISGNLLRTSTQNVMLPNLGVHRSSRQSKLLKNEKTSTHALCKNENQNAATFINAWHYFQQQKND